MNQLSLLTDVARDERPWKRTTTTSKAAVHAIEDSGEAARRRVVVLRGLRAYWNRFQQWPTADELAGFLFRGTLIGSTHRDEVQPRLNELVDGRWLRHRDAVTGEVSRRQVGGGEVERGAKRVSTVSGRTVLTWRVREAGSTLARNLTGETR